jgi:hypothetical protein
MRRRAGVGAIQDRKAAQEKFKEKGNEIQENLVAEVCETLYVGFLDVYWPCNLRFTGSQNVGWDISRYDTFISYS